MIMPHFTTSIVIFDDSLKWLDMLLAIAAFFLLHFDTH
jgi:hypothetical protein